ncbi:DUF58 domain-containing protein [Gephyromycinifex aptenodytis]|uniref:DUF58 domain-containing protein n=1 Tax=Gephyromycinifex aptenodytis TaxID=2716227 RepID=UPI001445685B|nr:DUF58 domain-containing protein [Gephyromycinifex aptenodytis]
MALTGRAVLLVLLGLIPAVIAPNALTVRLWIVACVALIGIDVFWAPRPQRVRLERTPTPPLRRGQTGQSTLLLTNETGRRLRGTLRDAWQPSSGASGERHRLDVARGSSVELTTTLRPTRRGDRLTDLVTMRLTGPLGLAARQASLACPGAVRVLPEFASQQHLPRFLAQLRELDGRSAVRTRGQGTEFDSLRDYVPGDDVRSIDWRATARRTAVVVRTWQPERDRHIVIVLDTSRTSAGRIADVPRLDAAMDAALLLTALATRAGDRVDLLAGDRELRAEVSGARSSDRLHHSIEAMATLEPALVEANWSRLFAAVAERSRGRALVVLLTPIEPASVSESLLPALSVLARRHQIIVASVQDPGLQAMTELAETAPVQPADVYDAAAATQARNARTRTAEVLAKLGVHVVDSPPQQLPLDLCEHYLALKARGAL